MIAESLSLSLSLSLMLQLEMMRDGVGWNRVGHSGLGVDIDSTYGEEDDSQMTAW